MFAELSSLPGELHKRVSRGSNTVEFLHGNVKGRSSLDTVYVTANPQLYRNRSWLDPSFHAIEDVWNGDDWDEERGTVLPETMADRTREALERFPNKRLIAHFVQPHYPFLNDEEVFGDGTTIGDDSTVSCWQQVMAGCLNAETADVWESYKKTFQRVISSVEKLLEHLSGKTVVTADHGNMIGERARPVPVTEWGHPHGIYTEELVSVPWLIYESGDRRTITDGAPVKMESTTEDVVTDRLEKLGYV
jgi:hypothetical protein